MTTLTGLFASSFTDHQLKQAKEAFEKAWIEIAFDYAVEDTAAARDRLALVVLRIIPLWTADTDHLAQVALINFLRIEGKGEGMD